MSKKTEKILQLFAVGSTFTANTELIVPRSMAARMRNFPGRVWHVIADEDDVYEDDIIMMVPTGERKEGPLVPNIKNLIVLTPEAAVELVSQKVLLPIKK